MKPIYSELAATSNFSFLQGASHPEEFVETAKTLGYKAIAITDHNSLAGIVRGHAAAKETGMQFVPGCRLIFSGAGGIQAKKLLDRGSSQARPGAGYSLLVYPTDRASYGSLCSLLTLGNRRAKKGQTLLLLEDFIPRSSGLITAFMPAPGYDTHIIEPVCRRLIESLPDKRLLSLALVRNYSNNSAKEAAAVINTARRLRVPLLATNDAYYHAPGRKMLQDVVTCIREGCSIQNAGLKLLQNGERYLKTPEEMERLYRDIPEAIERTSEIAELAKGFSLDSLKYEYPDAICPLDKTPLDYLTEITWAGAKERYPQGVPFKVAEQIKDELQLIHELQYEKYFLTCYDIVKFARSQGILCQGRGAAANSVVCFCLGITAVDPSQIDTLFARFVSKERNEPPDIDIDFEHERREEVIQYIYAKYGRAYAGLTAEVITYRHRSAIRETGKALGLSPETVDQLCKMVHHWTSHAVTAEDLKSIGLDIHNRTLLNLFKLSNDLLGFPRHLGQHVGGFIISQKPLLETVPILNAAMEDRTIIEWDKDDIEALGMLKIDVLALGMLTCLRKTLDLVNRRRKENGENELTLYNLPREDPKVYDMICEADTIGIFQIESRAQMSMLPRLKPRCFYDLVIEVAIVRPGPIQGKMVHPFLKRRDGLEKFSFPDERVEQILGKTMGVPLFQEQAMRLAIVLANFTPGEAEKLRRAMAAWKKDRGAIAIFKQRILEGMEKNGYSARFAETCVNQIKGFSEYGFPESHAASFALLVYASAYLKRYYPAEFLASLLNSQPMGFYAPAQIIRDAENHGIKVLPVDVNSSAWDSKVPSPAEIILGMRLVKGLQKEQAELIPVYRETRRKFKSVFDIWKCSLKHAAVSRLRRNTLEILARADAFASMNLNQREALWEIRALPKEVLPFDESVETFSSGKVSLPQMSRQQEMFQDYEMTGFSLRGHPIAFIRDSLHKRKAVCAAALRKNVKEFKGKETLVAGIPIFRQRPGTANGIVFVTLEDETGIVNLIIKPKVFETYQRIVLGSSAILAGGKVEFVGKQPYIDACLLEDMDNQIANAQGAPLPSRSYSY